MDIKNRIELAEYFNKLGFKKIAEVGVWQGYYSEVLCKKIPGLKLYAVDCWETYPEYKDHTRPHVTENAYKQAIARLAPYDATIIKDFSVHAARKLFANDSLDAVYLDGNHRYNHVKDDIRVWTPKVRIGGIVSGHDYYVTPNGNSGVIRAVDEYVKKHNYELHVIDWDKTTPLIDDQQPSWWFVRTH